MSLLVKTLALVNIKKIPIILISILALANYAGLEQGIKGFIINSNELESKGGLSGYTIAGSSINNTSKVIEETTCSSNWSCNEWSSCSSNSIRIRSCNDLNNCGSDENKPAETEECVYNPQIIIRTVEEPETSSIECYDNSDCDDGNACTINTCSNPGTVSASCTSIKITDPINNDGCCAPGAYLNDDNDCTECCPGTVLFENSCITPTCNQDFDCDDGIACTIDLCINPGTVNAACEHNPLIEPINDDGCCAPGAYLNDDNDCTECSPETILYEGACITPACSLNLDCDDGNTCTIDYCTNPWTAIALCEHTVITEPINDDGCCAQGAYLNDDNDCTECSPETILCEGSCTTPYCTQDIECDDGKKKTIDTCVNPGTCEAYCSNVE